MEALNSIAMFSGGMAERALPTLLLGIQYLLTIVVLRSLLKRVWLADVLAAISIALTGGVDYSDPFRFAVTAPVVVLAVYSIVWLMRRFGFVAMLADWWLNVVFQLVPPSLTAWYAGRYLVSMAIPFGIAAWSLWVILSDKRQFSAESAV